MKLLRLLLRYRQPMQKERTTLSLEEYHGELCLLIGLGYKMLSDMYWFSRKSVIHNNATLSSYFQLFLLHILGISQLSIMKWARSNLCSLACSKNPENMQLIMVQLLKFFSVAGQEVSSRHQNVLAQIWGSPKGVCCPDFSGLCFFLRAGS